MSEFIDENTENDQERSRITGGWQEAERRALSEPSFDFWEACPPFMPKEVIGAYVLQQGIDVPLIDRYGNRQEWEEALDQGVAMARSDMEQDYQGYSGLLSSKVLADQLYPYDFGASDAARDDIGEAIARNLRNGELDVTSYMETFFWNKEMNYTRDSMQKLGARAIDFGAPQASSWRYIPGMNLTVFRDPSLDGIYHVKTKPEQSYIMGHSVSAAHGGQISYERSGRPVPVSQMIDFYETIRSLPMFDVMQAPVIEMQMDEEGEFHFLQYLKTGHIVSPVDPFELPKGDSLIRTSNVRGVTEPDGMDVRIYIAPQRVTERMEGQGFYFGMNWPHDFGAQVMSAMGSVVLHEIYIGMKDDHWNSSPLYKPKVGAGLAYTSEGGEYAAQLGQMRYDHRSSEYSVYIDAHVTANGREATIESDWAPKFE